MRCTRFPVYISLSCKKPQANLYRRSGPSRSPCIWDPYTGACAVLPFGLPAPVPGRWGASAFGHGATASLHWAYVGVVCVRPGPGFRGTMCCLFGSSERIARLMRITVKGARSATPPLASFPSLRPVGLLPSFLFCVYRVYSSVLRSLFILLGCVHA